MTNVLETKSLSDLIVRRYTKSLENTKNSTVYDLFQWKKVDVVLRDYKTGRTLFDQKGLEFPEKYSQNACDIIATKYFRQAGVTSESGKETSMRQIVHRLVGFWTEAAYDEGLLNDDNKDIFYDEVAYFMLAQFAAPNSPQWFNTGLKFAYDIDKDSEGYYHYNQETKRVELSKDAYTRTAASACFILDIEDTLLGDKSITKQIETETRLFKYGSGTGSNFSKLRAVNEKLSGGGVSSGVMSFLRTLDRNAGAIKSGGTTRRAAKMVILDDNHPEIFDFVNWKSKEEEKVAALGKMGYDTDFNGEAYDTVSGQNSNNSIRVSDEFLEKATGQHENDDWELTGRVDSSVNITVSAKELFREWNYAAWRSGDPAPQYTSTINAWHTCPAGENGDTTDLYNMIIASNPCSEYFFLLDTACNLASINVLNFFDHSTGIFDVEGYVHVITFMQIVLEASIHWGQFPTSDVARRSHLFRTTGLGIANTGGLNLAMAHPYDSDEARAITASLTGIMTGQAYLVSSLMAKEVGSFDCYDINREHMLRVIRNHGIVAGSIQDKYVGLNYVPTEIRHDILLNEGLDDISLYLKTIWAETYSLGVTHGFRNAQVSVIAPTGTIAFAMDCESTSTEPFFSHVAYKKLAGGGFMEIVNPLIPVALRKLGYSEDQIKDIMEYVLRKETVTENGFSYEKIVDGKIEGAPHLKEEHLPIFDTANKTGTGTRFIEPMGHVRMMAALTPLVSGAISKTVNLPSDASVGDFEHVHIEAWKSGVKAIALYRDGCKESQPLNSATHNKVRELSDYKYDELLELAYKQQKELTQPIRKRPNGIRSGNVHEANVAGLKLFITVTSLQGEITELYATADKEGTIVKGLLDSLSKMISKSLQYGIPAEEISKSLRGQKYEPHGFVTGHPYIKHVDSLSDLLSKIIDVELGNFKHVQVKPDIVETESVEKTEIVVPNSTIDSIQSTEGELVFGQTCTTCGSTHMKKNGTCYVCSNCGTTSGCS